MAGASFKGFDPALLDFYRALATNNSRDWFEAHRAEYEALHLEPAKDFVAALNPGLSKLSADIKAAPKVGGAIGRINRDTRFSKNKSPYKANMFLKFDEGGPGTFMHLGADRWVIAGGWFTFDKAPRDRFRAAVDDEAKAKALEKAVAKLTKAGFEGPRGASLKTVPRGFDKDHPRAGYLRHGAFFMVHVLDDPAPLFSDQAVPFFLKQAKALRPLNDWLKEHVAA